MSIDESMQYLLCCDPVIPLSVVGIHYTVLYYLSGSAVNSGTVKVLLSVFDKGVNPKRISIMTKSLFACLS